MPLKCRRLLKWHGPGLSRHRIARRLTRTPSAATSLSTLANQCCSVPRTSTSRRDRRGPGSCCHAQWDPVLHMVGPAAVKLELPPHYRLHPVFHVSLIRRYNQTRHTDVPPPPLDVDTDGAPFYEAKAILAHRPAKGANKGSPWEFYVKWQGNGSSPMSTTHGSPSAALRTLPTGARPRYRGLQTSRALLGLCCFRPECTLEAELIVYSDPIFLAGASCGAGGHEASSCARTAAMVMWALLCPFRFLLLHGLSKRNH